MPTYDYVCQACDHDFEAYQSITAKPLRKCPACGGRRVVRLIGTGGGVIFKGSGFYETDYRSEQYKKAAKQEAQADAPKSDKTDKTDKAKQTATSAQTDKPAKTAGKAATGKSPSTAATE